MRRSTQCSSAQEGPCPDKLEVKNTPKTRGCYMLSLHTQHCAFPPPSPNPIAGGGVAAQHLTAYHQPGEDPHLKLTAWFVLNVCQFHVIVELGLSVFLSFFFLNKRMPSQKPLIPLVQDDVLCVLISQSLSRACNYSHTWQSFQG